MSGPPDSWVRVELGEANHWRVGKLWKEDKKGGLGQGWGVVVNSIYLFNKSPNCFAIMSNYMVPVFGMFSKPQAQPLSRTREWAY